VAGAAAPLPFAGAKPIVVVVAIGALVALLVFIVVVDVRSRADEAAPPTPTTTTPTTTTTRAGVGRSGGTVAPVRPRPSPTDPALPDGVPVTSAVVRWKVALPTRADVHWRTPRRLGALIVVPSDHGGVVAIDAATHAVRWEVDGTSNLATAQVTQAEGSSTLLVKQDGAVLGVDPDTGRTKWSQPTPFPVSLRGNADHVVMDNGATMACFDPDTGEKQWEVPSEHREIPRPSAFLLRSATIVAEAPAALFALDAASGQELWRVPVEGPDIHRMVGTETTRFASIGDRSLAAFDPSNGVERWRVVMAPNTRAADFTFFDPEIADQLIVQAGPQLISLDPADGSARWVASVDGGVVPHDSGAPQPITGRLLLNLLGEPARNGVLVKSAVDGAAIGFLDFGPRTTVQGFGSSGDDWITVVGESAPDAPAPVFSLTAVAPR
jgi:outer membrane protein assembly factor BamB